MPWILPHSDRQQQTRFTESLANSSDVFLLQPAEIWTNSEYSWVEDYSPADSLFSGKGLKCQERHQCRCLQDATCWKPSWRWRFGVWVPLPQARALIMGQLDQKREMLWLSRQRSPSHLPGIPLCWVQAAPVLYLGFGKPRFEVLISIPALCKRLWGRLTMSRSLPC